MVRISFLIIILVLSFTLTADAQKANQAELDSLFAVWQDNSQSDSARGMAFNYFIWNGFIFSRPDTAYTLANELLEFGINCSDLNAQAYGLQIIGTSYWLRGEDQNAIEYYARAIKIFDQIGNENAIGSNLTNIGDIYYTQGNYPMALDYCNEALIIKEKTGDQRGVAGALLSIGLIYLQQEDYDKALEYLKLSSNYADELDDRTFYGLASLNIGNVYLNQGNLAKALEIFTQTLEIFNKVGSPATADCLTNMGAIYAMQGDYSKAIDCHSRSLEISRQVGIQHGVAVSLGNIGAVYEKTKNYSKSIEFCQEGYELGVAVNGLKPQKTACQCLYDAYKAIDNFKKALEYHEILSAIKDSLESQDMGEVLQQMEFDKAMSNDSIAKAEEARLVEESHLEEVRQKNKTRNMLAVGGLIVLLLAGGIYSRLRYTNKAKAIIEKEKDRSENLLLNILPAEIAEELKAKGSAEAVQIDQATVLFTDFKGFTAMSEQLSPKDLVNDLNLCFTEFDRIIGEHNIEKIKTIGDAYMAAGGLPTPNSTHAKDVVEAALKMRDFVEAGKAKKIEQGLPYFEIRIGVHTGPVVAGIVGVKKFQYDIWGDTVNTASRMESSGEVGKVNISQATYELLKGDSQFAFENRGKIEAKGKGEMEMWFVQLKNN